MCEIFQLNGFMYLMIQKFNKIRHAFCKCIFFWIKYYTNTISFINESALKGDVYYNFYVYAFMQKWILKKSLIKFVNSNVPKTWRI